ncbi:MAG: sulfurtransferase TusA family protein [Prevotella sp.]|nr:sulfurtransferase TusA family protein [Prevotella sp.]
MVKVPVNVNVNNDIEKFARLANGYQQQTVSTTEFKAFRVPMGVYEQRKNEVYMARIRATGGVIKPEQLLRVIDIAKENGSNLLHITTRAEVQILNLQLDKMENVLRQLQEAGLSTKGGGGNTVRNIIVSEFSGIDKDEVFDTTPYAIALANAVVPEPDSYLMPRKMKIAFSSNDKFIDYAGINDIGFVAQIKDGKRGFKVYIGGGAGSKPSVGWLWRDFLPAEDLYALVKAMKKFFIDHGNRKDKYKARIRFIFYKLGKEETFRLIYEYFEKEKATLHSPLTNSPLSKRGGRGESFVVPITLGNIHLDDEEKVGALKDLIRFVAQFGDDTLRFTTRQNIRLRNIPAEAQDELSKYIKRYVPENFSKPAVINNIVSCTGADTCRLGICLSKGLTNAIIRALEKSGLDLDLLQDARINVSGCPNLCGQPLWSDLGFVGKVLHTDHVYPAYQVYVGANYTDSPALAESIGTISAYDTPKFVVDLVKKFSEAKPQTFNSWLRSAEGRATAEELIAKYKDIPPFAEDKNYYFDWGSDEVFNVTKRGKPECSAGLFDMIQVDQDAIKEARDKSAYDVIFHASRMLLVTRGLDPQDAAGVFDAFIEHFINTGYVDSAFKALISQAKAEGKQGSYDNAKANALADAVIELYQGMDDSLNFKASPQPSHEGKGGGRDRLKDLRGVLCPMNFVKTKLELATMQSGDVLEIWLDDGKPIENVPGSVKLEGHEILSQTQHTDGYWQVLIKKK